MFADTAKIYIRSGNGGDGHVSFRREKYVPNGGPDGGDGGRGGDIVAVVDGGLNTLADFRYKRKFCAQNGEPGRKRNCHGKNGEDLVLKLPLGTIIRDLETDKVIADMSVPGERRVILKGGRGGLGNQNFATATMQAPKYAQPGREGIGLEVRLELKVIADVGLVGFPNVGKSTLLSRVSNARPKIANYHFTTLRPNLGVVDLEDGQGFVMADIPGLIEGAAEGVGLGHDFLRHIERTRLIVHLVDAASTEGRDPLEDIHAINRELQRYSEGLAKLPQVIAANKMDVLGEAEAEEVIARLRQEFEPQGCPVFPISAVSGAGVREILYHIHGELAKLPDEPIIFAQEFFPETIVREEEPYTVTQEEGIYVVEGAAIEKMLGYTNIESEKGFLFFQNFMKERGILEKLKEAGIQEGDTVKIYGLQFDYYE